MNDIWNILLIAALVAGLVLFLMYPYQPQSPEVLKQYQQDVNQNTIVVIYQTNSVDKAKEQFYKDYPDYTIVEIYKGRHGVIIRGVRK